MTLMILKDYLDIQFGFQNDFMNFKRF